MKQEGKTTALRWLWRVSGKSKCWMFLRTLGRTGQGLIAIFYAHSLGNVVDAAASGNRAMFTREMSWFAVYALSSILLMLLNRYLQEKSKITLEKTFCLRVFSQLLYRDYGEISQTHNGEWMTRITSDTNVIATAISQFLPEIISALVRVGGALLALHQILPQVTWVLILGGLLMASVSFVMQKRLKGYHKDIQKADGKVRSFMQERLYSLLVIHAFTQEPVSRSMAADKYDRLNEARMRRHRFVLVCVAAIGGAMVAAQLLGVGMCGLGILSGTLSYGTVSTVLYLINMLEAPLNTISSYVSQYYSMIASAERLMEIECFDLDAESEPVSPKKVQKYYSEEFSSLGLENADFAYEEGEENAVLRNFSFRIEKGDYVAFTGESGCGKSTTLKILLGLYPLDGGNAYLQDADGTQQPLDGAWRGLFAYVPQGNQLISGTVRETLTFGDPEQMAQDEKLYRALEIACADSFVRELPNGLDTVLGERGSGLSEGQVQRLSTARAILTERPILLLDESTSALDAATEEQLLKNLRAMTDRTVLIITHREAALAICNKRIHFEKSTQR